MKYCVNSLVTLAAANPISPQGVGLAHPCDGLGSGCYQLGPVPYLPCGARCSWFSQMCPSPASVWAGKPVGWGKRGPAAPCISHGGVTPPACEHLTGTWGWTFWGRHCHSDAIKWLQQLWAHGPPSRAQGTHLRPCPTQPCRHLTTAGIKRNSLFLSLNSICSQIMYKTFAETTYSSCIFYESDPKLKYINIKISRSTLGKKKLFHKISGDQFKSSPSLPPARAALPNGEAFSGFLPPAGTIPIIYPAPASGRLWLSHLRNKPDNFI